MSDSGVPNRDATEPTQPAERRAPRVLVVEDDPAIHDFLVVVLRDAACDVRGADFGGKALYVVDQWEPDLILLDMQMPVVTGWDFVREYRSRPGRHAPIVCVTAATDVAQRAAEIGADGVLGKPFSVAQLLETVGRFIPISGGYAWPARQR